MERTSQSATLRNTDTVARQLKPGKSFTDEHGVTHSEGAIVHLSKKQAESFGSHLERVGTRHGLAAGDESELDALQRENELLRRQLSERQPDRPTTGTSTAEDAGAKTPRGEVPENMQDDPKSQKPTQPPSTLPAGAGVATEKGKR